MAKNETVPELGNWELGNWWSDRDNVARNSSFPFFPFKSNMFGVEVERSTLKTEARLSSECPQICSSDR